MSPKVSVIMSVYNGERYLREAVESILNQTFTDFELILLDDSSSDNTWAQLLKYAADDHRVRLVKNERNLGLAKSLNKLVSMCKGAYIARMDADDISQPDRLEKQVKFLEANSQVSLLFAYIKQIDSDGNDCGTWQDDIINIHNSEICNTLPVTNCVAHPTLMARTNVMKSYLYSENSLVRHTEDYELWLRVASDGHVIEKLPLDLLLYRIHDKSVTTSSNASANPLKKLIASKLLFLVTSLRRFKLRSFELKVIKYLIKDIDAVYFSSAVEKWTWEFATCISSFMRFFKSKVQLIRLCINIAKTASNTNVFMFFPYYHVGGAEKVHSQIVNAIHNCNPVVFFTAHSQNDGFKQHFVGSSAQIELTPYLASYRDMAILTRLIAYLINRKQRARVFGCNSQVLYDLLPFLNSNIMCVDMIHAFSNPDPGFEDIGLQYASRLDHRVVINNQTYLDFKEQYNKNGFDLSLLNRIVCIRNYVYVPPSYNSRQNHTLRIIYVGRNSPEKRIHLVESIAKTANLMGMPVTFSIIGDIEPSKAGISGDFCKMEGIISDQSDLALLYQNADILLLTSYREGVPMVIMEAMAYGVIPIATNVGGVSEIVKHGETGFLIDNNYDEDNIVSSAIATIQRLVDQPSLRHEVSRQAYCFAHDNFSADKFVSAYKDLLCPQ